MVPTCFCSKTTFFGISPCLDESTSYHHKSMTLVSNKIRTIFCCLGVQKVCFTESYLVVLQYRGSVMPSTDTSDPERVLTPIEGCKGSVLERWIKICLKCIRNKLVLGQECFAWVKDGFGSCLHFHGMLKLVLHPLYTEVGLFPNYSRSSFERGLQIRHRHRWFSSNRYCQPYWLSLQRH